MSVIESMHVCVFVAEWNQYDGVTFPEISKGWRNIVTFGLYDENGKFMTKQTTEAFQCWLPRWIGLYVEGVNCDAGMACFNSISQLGNAFLASVKLHQLIDNRQPFIEVC